MQLYHLLSIYKIIRPPKFGNCSNSDDLQNKSPHITFQEFQSCFSNRNQSYRQEHIHNSKLRIENIIETDNWECHDLEIEEGCELSKDMKDLVLYSNCGYICRKMLKRTKCECCRTAFISYENNAVLPVAKLVNNRTKGKLIYANVKLYEMLSGIDKFIENHIDDNELYWKVLDDISNNNIKFNFPCEEHKCKVIPEIIYDYILMRMLQYSRLLRRDSTKEAKSLKKEAKLKKT